MHTKEYDMKGIVLAGGSGSRLYPLSKAVNKHLLPVGRYPMIYYPIYKLKEAGIEEIFIVTGKEHAGSIAGFLGSGQELGLMFTYGIQDKPGGIAHALSLAEGFVGDNRCVVILGDNIFEDSLSEYVAQFKTQKEGAMVLLSWVVHPQRYGIAELDGRNPPCYAAYLRNIGVKIARLLYFSFFRKISKFNEALTAYFYNQLGQFFKIRPFAVSNIKYFTIALFI
jgi:NDP-sugar pyrophosphorylase family protein